MKRFKLAAIAVFVLVGWVGATRNAHIGLLEAMSRQQGPPPAPPQAGAPQTVPSTGQVPPASAAPVPAALPMRVTLRSVDNYGVKFYSVVSDYLGDRETTVRVLEPTAPRVPNRRRVMFVLPVIPGVVNVASPYGDGLDELRLLDVPNRYNVTLVEPSFYTAPWYADHDSDPGIRLESFIVRDLVPFADSLVPGTGLPRRWLIGFSKSGFGALGLLFRHPTVFSAVAAWDAPAQLPAMEPGLDMEENYGSEENFARYRIPELITAHADEFKSPNRIWISGDLSAWTPHMLRLDQQLTAAGIPHTMAPGQRRLHTWYSGWLAGAVAGLAANPGRVPTASPGPSAGPGTPAPQGPPKE